MTLLGEEDANRLRTSAFPWGSVKQWWEYISEQLNGAGDEGCLEQIACCMWGWWKHRCSLVFGESPLPFDFISHTGVQLARDYKEANHNILGGPGDKKKEELRSGTIG
ncbi:hypothetical protein LIER_25986 [Lithospermum erythrorhizon]|uniref:Uncharacterized protein n=1 Tax=Lithospermum erythrorhizon TaxID=34254 RepID=A0AAV3R718_LITER